MDEVLDLKPGSTLWLEGERWAITELAAATVTLASGTRVRKITPTSLIGKASSVTSPAAPSSHANIDVTDRALIESLPRKVIEELTQRASIFDELLTSGGAGGAALADAKAAEQLGISQRQVRRLKKQYRERGLAGLIDARLSRGSTTAVEAGWDDYCRTVLESYRNKSNPTVQTIIATTNQLFAADHPGAKLPSKSTAYIRVRQLDKGRYTFGDAKQRRSVANRPKGPFGRLEVDRPGQYVVLDTNSLDVFAMEPVSCRWVNVELTVAMDVYSRSITGLTLRPVSTTAQDVAAVLHQTVTPQTWGRSSEGKPGPYVGVPENVITEKGGPVSNALLPDSIIVDHGKVYLSHHVLAVCHRLGINVQPARTYKATDKAVIERFFKTLRESLLQHLPAYKGPDVSSRGKSVEKDAFLYVSELEQIIREWVGIYHDTPHDGLVVCPVNSYLFVG